MLPEKRRHFTDSDELCEHVAKLSEGRVVLSFSGGKDAVGAYLQLRRHFHNIDYIFMYLIPGLSFVEEALAYYEGVFGKRIGFAHLPLVAQKPRGSAQKPGDSVGCARKGVRP